MESNTCETQQAISQIETQHPSIKQVNKNGSHYYSLDGVAIERPSVTTYLQVVAKPGLEKWKQNMFVSDIQARLEAGESFEAASKNAKQAASQKASRAAEIGTATHNRIESLIHKRQPASLAEFNQTEQDRICNMANLALKILDQRNIQPLFTEYMVYRQPNENPEKCRQEGGFGGTVDLIGYYPREGYYCVIDWKTGGFYPSQNIQIAAYMHAVAEQLGIHPRHIVGHVFSLRSNPAESSSVFKPEADKLFSDFCGIQRAWASESKTKFEAAYSL